MKLFNHKQKIESKTYDREHLIPVIKSSICTGEKTACFQDRESKKVHEIMLIKDEKDLMTFKQMYGIEEDIQTIY